MCLWTYLAEGDAIISHHAQVLCILLLVQTISNTLKGIMNRRFHNILLTAGALIATAISLPAATIYTATLSGANEVPAVPTPGIGSATLTLNGDLLNVAVSFSGLTTNDTMSHIHCCAPVGTNAPVALGFTTFPIGVTSGSFNFTYDLTNISVYTTAFVTAYGGTAASAEAALINGLNTGQSYVNIHTTANPGGEIRGQVATTPEPSSFLLGAGALVSLVFFSRKRIFV